MNLSELTPDPRNANKGTERGRNALEHSLRSYGAGRSILLDKHGTIIAGNKTAETAADIGIDEVVVVETDGNKVVAVKRTDLDLAKDPAARELAYADNRVSELDLDFDPQAILTDLQEGVSLENLWSQAELDQMLKDLTPPTDAPEAQTDRAAELQEKWQTERGQVWEIGRHRLMCGDSTSEEDVAHLLDGNTPNLTVTDPPYGVDYDPAWRNEAAEKGHLAYSARRVGKVANDDRVDWSRAWHLSPSSVVYCWHADRHASEVQEHLRDAGFEHRAQIVWVKANFPISRGHYTWRHEPCWYAVKQGATAGWIGPHTSSTVWDDITLDANVDGGHGTQKPVECMARPIRNHEGDVYDPFLGSGTTMVAAEQLNRTCYGMEIDPGYCGVVLERMSDTGLEPTVIERDN